MTGSKSDYSYDNIFGALYEDKDLYLSPHTRNTVNTVSNDILSKNIFEEFKKSKIQLEKYSSFSDKAEYIFENLHQEVDDLLRSVSQISQFDNNSKNGEHSSAYTETQNKEDESDVKPNGLSVLDILRKNLKSVGKNPFKHFHFSILHIRLHPHKSAIPSLARCMNMEDRLNVAARIISDCWHTFIYRTVYIYLRNLIQCYSKLNPSILRYTNPNEASLVIDPAVGTQLRFRLGGVRFPPIVLYRIYTTCPVVCVHFRDRNGNLRRAGRCRDSRQHSKDFNCWRPWKDRFSTFPLCSKPKNTRKSRKTNPLSHLNHSKMRSTSGQSSTISACLSPTTHLVEDLSFPKSVLLHLYEKPPQFDGIDDLKLQNYLNLSKITEFGKNDLKNKTFEEEEEELMSWVENI